MEFGLHEVTVLLHPCNQRGSMSRRSQYPLQTIKRRRGCTSRKKLQKHLLNLKAESFPYPGVEAVSCMSEAGIVYVGECKSVVLGRLKWKELYT